MGLLQNRSLLLGLHCLTREYCKLYSVEKPDVYSPLKKKMKTAYMCNSVLNTLISRNFFKNHVGGSEVLKFPQCELKPCSSISLSQKVFVTQQTICFRLANIYRQLDVLCINLPYEYMYSAQNLASPFKVVKFKEKRLASFTYTF